MQNQVYQFVHTLQVNEDSVQMLGLSKDEGGFPVVLPSCPHRVNVLLEGGEV